MSWVIRLHTAVLSILFCATLSAVAQTSGPIQGLQDLDREPSAETQNRIFQKNNNKLDQVKESASAPAGGSAETESKSSEDLDLKDTAITTTFGVRSKVFPFNTSSAAAGNLTFLRLINPESFSNEIAVEIRSLDSENFFVFEGTCNVSVPAKASIQLAYDYFENCIGWSPTSSQTVMFLEFDAGLYVYWQNVVWSPTTGYFGNVSSCREPTVSDQFIHNVHTSKIVGYPSVLIGLVDVFESYSVDINIYDAANGDLIGRYLSGLFPQNTVVLTLEAQDLEQAATWFISLANLPYQINLEFNLVNQFGFNITQGRADLTSHAVLQTATGEAYNMLNSCAY